MTRDTDGVLACADGLSLAQAAVLLAAVTDAHESQREVAQARRWVAAMVVAAGGEIRIPADVLLEDHDVAWWDDPMTGERVYQAWPHGAKRPRSVR